MISYDFSHISLYDLLTPHTQVRFRVDLFLTKHNVQVHTKLPPCKIVDIFLLGLAVNLKVVLLLSLLYELSY